MSIYRYSGWDKSQDNFDLDPDALIDDLGQKLMSSSNLSDSLHLMQRTGIRDSQGRQLPGIEELLQQLNQIRQNELEKQKLRSMMDEAYQKLENMLKTGQMGTSGRLGKAGQEPGEGGGKSGPGGRQATEDIASRGLDGLIEQLLSKIARAQSSLDNLSPKSRKSLENLLQSILNETSQYELAKLAASLEALYPSSKLPNQPPISGRESISGIEARKLMEMLRKMDKLQAQLRDCIDNLPLEVVDEQLLRELMGDETAGELETLRNIPRSLEEAGYIRCKEGRYELTPRAMRKIGQKALEDIFAQLRKDGPGRHKTNLRGSGGERIDETKKYESGDDFQIYLQKTIMNSIYRELRKPPIRLSAEDFEIFRTESLTRSATVLMIDLSFSMAARGRFQAAKRVAIALDGLIRSQFPKDSLYIVGFSTYARRIRKEDLSYINWDEFDIYTNIQHGLYLAAKMLAKEMCANKQIILVSDGEPTAHVEGENTFFHQVPPSPRTIQLTLREARSCAQKGIVINTFMLENDRFLSAFVTQMARINRGRVFFTSPDTLGQYLLADYISNKRRRLSTFG